MGTFIFDTTSRALDGYLRNILTPDFSTINSSTSDHVVKKFLFEESDVEKSRVLKEIRYVYMYYDFYGYACVENLQWLLAFE